MHNNTLFDGGVVDCVSLLTQIKLHFLGLV